MADKEYIERDALIDDVDDQKNKRSALRAYDGKSCHCCGSKKGIGVVVSCSDYSALILPGMGNAELKVCGGCGCVYSMKFAPDTNVGGKEEG